MNSGAELWKKAKRLIPGGNQLLSKRSEMFLPDFWPSYYKKSKGVEIWDLDDNKYIDMSIMGVGTSVLGYADDDVDNAVINAIKSGNMSTLNAPEEIELAEMLIKQNPWAQMVRYARTGGEAMAIAVRIARASTKKEKLAFCGYHGWHDWYLSANLADDSALDGQLLPGLLPLGVPKSLKGTSIPFEYNKIEQLETIIEKNDIGTIILETIRNHEPKDGFLQSVRKIANEHNCILIFDEITSGFRINVGGAYLKYGVNPDIVVYAKAMGNGYPMAAIVGKQEVMDAAQESFISSTYWTDKIGPTAAITTLNKMTELKVPNHLIKIGNIINKNWGDLADEYDINLEITGIPPLTHFNIKHENSLGLRTLFTQEMFEQGFLASGAVYVSNMHTEENVEKYTEVVSDAFKKIRIALDTNNLKEQLKGPIAHSGFHRLN